MDIDVNKVIAGLKCCIRQAKEGIVDCSELNCPYFEDKNRLACWISLNEDAAALLQGQTIPCDPCAEEQSTDDEVDLEKTLGWLSAVKELLYAQYKDAVDKQDMADSYNRYIAVCHAIEYIKGDHL